jgi:hypothetical protein
VSEGVIWKEPPPPRNGNPGRAGVWLALLAELRERPGEWALLRSYENKRTAYRAANDLKRGRASKAFDPDEYEITVRSTADDGGDVYGRYLKPAVRRTSCDTQKGSPEDGS